MPDGQEMQIWILTPFLMLAFSSCASEAGSIDQGKADAIAQRLYRNFQKLEPQQAALLGPQTVEVLADGWHYQWACQASKTSGLGIHVGKNGEADFDEAPSCSV